MKGEETMPVSEAQMRASRKYDQKAYDRILVLFKKGEKDKIRAAAAIENKSVNGYITSTVMRDVEEKITAEADGCSEKVQKEN